VDLRSWELGYLLPGSYVTIRLLGVFAISTNQELVQKCPFCAEVIKAEAIKCRFCGSDLRQQGISRFVNKSPTSEPEKQFNKVANSNDIDFQCDECGQLLHVDRASIGSTVTCPSCRASIVVRERQSHEKSERYCMNCNANVWVDSQRPGFCPQCGTRW
jgi:DNA-directed RNA polymerase subunit RPC12/RpoP